MNEHSHTRRIAVIVAVLVALALAVGALVGFAGKGGAGVAGRAQSTGMSQSGGSPTSQSSEAQQAPHDGTPSSPPPTSSSGHRTPAASPTPLAHSIPLDWRTSVTLNGPDDYRGYCPVPLESEATITVNHTPADVTYIWNDGTATAPVTVHVTRSPLVVTRSLTPSDSLTGTLSLNVLAPEASSATRHFTVQCIGVSVGHASTDPAAYTGPCGSREFPFTTSVPVTVTGGPFLLHYQWVRSDGSYSPVSSLYFGSSASTQTLSYTWIRFSPTVMSSPDDEWVQLHILDLDQQISNESHYSFWCV